MTADSKALWNNLTLKFDNLTLKFDNKQEETGESWFPLVIYILFEKNSRKCKSTCEWKQVVRIRHDML